MPNQGFFLDLQSGRRRRVQAVAASAGVADANKLARLNPAGVFDETLFPPGVRKADATAEGKEANGFVKQAFANAAAATVITEGTLAGLTGLTTGARYYLSTTAGLVTITPPSGAGNVVQFLGTASSATELLWKPDDAVTIE
jgi:hypothetical protein